MLQYQITLGGMIRTLNKLMNWLKRCFNQNNLSLNQSKKKGKSSFSKMSNLDSRFKFNREIARRKIQKVMSYAQSGSFQKFWMQVLKLGRDAATLEYVFVTRMFREELQKDELLALNLFLARYRNAFSRKERIDLRRKVTKYIVAEKI